MLTSQISNTRLAAAIGAGLGVSLFTVYVVAKWRRRLNYWNTPFVEAGRVDRLFLYPIKSCKGVEVIT
jgi:hypothetical protein